MADHAEFVAIPYCVITIGTLAHVGELLLHYSASISSKRRLSNSSCVSPIFPCFSNRRFVPFVTRILLISSRFRFRVSLSDVDIAYILYARAHVKVSVIDLSAVVSI